MRRLFRIDPWLVTPAIILCVISLVMLFSIDTAYFKSQLFALFISLAAFLFFSQVNETLLKQIKVPIYLISLLLLCVVLVLGIKSRGAIRWIDILGVRAQFSEILKPFLAVAFAALLSEQARYGLRWFFQLICLVLPVILLIYFQPDLGNALIYIGAVIFVLLVAGVPLRLFGLALIPLVMISPLLWTLLHPYQRQRLLTFLHPHIDPLGASYNTIQAIIAIGSGSFLGKGLSQGTQAGLRFLPEGHTDFIFATLSESLGFIGSIIIIMLFAVLCYRMYSIFKNSSDIFTKLFAASAFAFFLIQVVINIGMNIGYLPIVGVTLPFVSFGGSSLLASFIFLGILSSLQKDAKHKNVLEIK